MKNEHKYTTYIHKRGYALKFPVSRRGKEDQREREKFLMLFFMNLKAIS